MMSSVSRSLSLEADLPRRVLNKFEVQLCSTKLTLARAKHAVSLTETKRGAVNAREKACSIDKSLTRTMSMRRVWPLRQKA